MTCVLWDKQSPIYDITAEQAMKNNPLYASENSYVFYRDDGSIYDIIPISYLPAGETDEARCQAFIARLTGETVSEADTDTISADEALAILIRGDSNG